MSSQNKNREFSKYMGPLFVAGTTALGTAACETPTVSAPVITEAETSTTILTSAELQTVLQSLVKSDGTITHVHPETHLLIMGTAEANQLALSLGKEYDILPNPIYLHFLPDGSIIIKGVTNIENENGMISSFDRVFLRNPGGEKVEGVRFELQAQPVSESPTPVADNVVYFPADSSITAEVLQRNYHSLLQQFEARFPGFTAEGAIFIESPVNEDDKIWFDTVSFPVFSQDGQSVQTLRMINVLWSPSETSIPGLAQPVGPLQFELREDGEIGIVGTPYVYDSATQSFVNPDAVAQVETATEESESTPAPEATATQEARTVEGIPEDIRQYLPQKLIDDYLKGSLSFLEPDKAVLALEDKQLQLTVTLKNIVTGAPEEVTYYISTENRSFVTEAEYLEAQAFLEDYFALPTKQERYRLNGTLTNELRVAMTAVIHGGGWYELLAQHYDGQTHYSREMITRLPEQTDGGGPLSPWEGPTTYNYFSTPKPDQFPIVSHLETFTRSNGQRIAFGWHLADDEKTIVIVNLTQNINPPIGLTFENTSVQSSSGEHTGPNQLRFGLLAEQDGKWRFQVSPFSFGPYKMTDPDVQLYLENIAKRLGIPDEELTRNYDIFITLYLP